MVDWFKKAVKDKPPYTLKGWNKNLPPSLRRSKALNSRPSNWPLKKKRLSAARALQALANITQDFDTRVKAKSDADYFFKLVKRK